MPKTSVSGQGFDSGFVPPVSLGDIESAKNRIRNVVIETPLILAHKVSEQVGVPVYLKCENLQVTSSFKARGASNFVLSYVEEQERRGEPLKGVVTASSGNHGQAVAYAARKVGLPCTVVVPEDVISVKEQAIRSHGANVVRCGVTSSERITYAEKLSEEQGVVFVPPYDHPDIVAGQGTAGLEIKTRLPQVREVFVPVGGGGLISGISTSLKLGLTTGNQPIRVIGVEPEIANDTFLSVQRGEVVDIGPTTTIADGLRTSHPGTFTFPIVKNFVDEIALVTESEILAAMRELFEAKLVVEPSGCVSLAAVLALHRRGNKWSGPIVCVLSGGNVANETFAEALR